MIIGIIFFTITFIVIAILFYFLHEYHLKMIKDKDEEIVDKIKKVATVFSDANELKHVYIDIANSNVDMTRSALAEHEFADAHFSATEKQTLFDNLEKNQVQLNDSVFDDTNSNLSLQYNQMDVTEEALDNTQESLNNVTSKYVDELKLQHDMTENRRELESLKKNGIELTENVFGLMKSVSDDAKQIDSTYQKVLEKRELMYPAFSSHVSQFDIHYPINSIE